MIKTHEIFDTVNHTHVGRIFPNNDYISLMLAECSNGQWFIECELPEDEKTLLQFTDVCLPWAERLPKFFSSDEETKIRANEIIDILLKSNLK